MAPPRDPKPSLGWPALFSPILLVFSDHYAPRRHAWGAWRRLSAKDGLGQKQRQFGSVAFQNRIWDVESGMMEESRFKGGTTGAYCGNSGDLETG